MAVSLDLRDDERGYMKKHISNDNSFSQFFRIHPRDKLDVGYRLSQSGLAVAYGFNNITYQGPVISNIVVSQDSSQMNVTYSLVKSIELRNPAGFEVCCQGASVCSTNDQAWVSTLAQRSQADPLTITLAGHDACKSKQLNGLRYLWRETPCLFKQAAVYNGEDSDLPGPPYIKYF